MIAWLRITNITLKKSILYLKLAFSEITFYKYSWFRVLCCNTKGEKYLTSQCVYSFHVGTLKKKSVIAISTNVSKHTFT